MTKGQKEKSSMGIAENGRKGELGMMGVSASMGCCCFSVLDLPLDNDAIGTSTLVVRRVAI